MPNYPYICYACNCFWEEYNTVEERRLAICPTCRKSNNVKIDFNQLSTSVILFPTFISKELSIDGDIEIRSKRHYKDEMRKYAEKYDKTIINEHMDFVTGKNP